MAKRCKDKHGRSGEVRIIGGEWRGRRIRFPAELAIRPTPDRLRETLFNWLGDWTTGRRVLDLFAGSGALGIEALSRGAASAVFIERDVWAMRALKSNLRALHASQTDVIHADALRWLDMAREPFDLVFLDPPYALNETLPVLDRLGQMSLLRADHKVYLEQPRSKANTPLPEGWTTLRTSHAGDAHGLLARFDSSADGGCIG